EHYASLDDIDAAMKLGGGYPMGPFELLDVVGLDVSLAIEKVLHREFRDPGLAPAPLLEHLVAAGCLGRKTGRGFREYAKRRASPRRLVRGRGGMGRAAQPRPSAAVRKRHVSPAPEGRGSP